MKYTGTVEFIDIGPGYYELVTPTCRYRLALPREIEDTLASIGNKLPMAEFSFEGLTLGAVVSVGATTRQTLKVSGVNYRFI